jgi:hypothetical protein
MLEKNDFVPTMSALARALGVTPAAVRKALLSHRIPREPDGSFHVARCRQSWHENTVIHGGRRSPPRDGEGVARKSTRRLAQDAMDRGVEQVEVSADATAAVTETLAAHGAPVEGLPTLRDAQTAEVILRARKIQLDVERLRGKLVEREKAHGVLSTFTRTTRDALLTWPASAAPGIASELGLADLAKVEVVLAKYLREHMATLSAVPSPDDLLPVTT